MTTDAVTDYRQQSREFFSRARQYLADGDLHQASEKGWGAASHMIKAVAEVRGQQYTRHEVFRNLLTVLGTEIGDPRMVLRLGRAAEGLHSNYYRRKRFLNANEIADDLDEVASLLDLLEPLTTR